MEGHSKKAEEEDDIVAIEAEDELDVDEIRRFRLCLFGRLWFDTPHNSGALQSTIKQIWRVKDGVGIRSIGENLYSFQFFNWRDKERVIQGEPWWFDKKSWSCVM